MSADSSPFDSNPFGNNPFGSDPFGNTSFDNNPFNNGTSLEESPTSGYRLHISSKKIIAAMIGGSVGMIINKILLSTLLDKMWNPLLIALCFLIEAIFICIPIFVVSSLLAPDHYLFTKKNANKDKLRLFFPLAFVVIFLFSGLFEFLYELSSNSPQKSTSYIFALDVSDSMEGTDEQHQLGQAMSKMVENMEDGDIYSVYTFGNDVKQISEPHKKSDADLSIDWDQAYSGSTALFTTLSTILDATEDTETYGKSPRVIVITDGYPTDDGLIFHKLNKYCKKLSKKHINVFTIGVAGANTDFLSELASKTGGVSYYTNDMSSLGDIFTTAIHSNTTSARTLLSYRSYTKHNTLLAFLHILFVFVIGLFFLPTIYFANCIEEDLTYIGLVKGITALAGAVLLEILPQNTGLPSFMILLIFGILTGFSILHTWERPKESNNSSYSQSFTTQVGNSEPISEDYSHAFGQSRPDHSQNNQGTHAFR